MEECLVGTELKWYYLVGQEQHGPLTESELRLLIADGSLDQESLVWSKLLSGWMPVAEVALLTRPDDKRPSTKPLTPVALRFVGGPRDGETIKLAEQMQLGRSSSNDITLDSTTVSGQHARISRHGMTYLLEDLGSTNGTWVNGACIDSETWISIGDTIHIGNTMIEVLGAGETGPEQSLSAPAVAATPSSPPAVLPAEPSDEPPEAESVVVPSEPPPPIPVVSSQPPEPSSPEPEPSSASEPVVPDFGDKLLDTSVELQERVVEQPADEPEEQPLVKAEEQPVIEAEEQPLVETEEQPVVEAEEQPLVEVEEQPLVEAEEQPVVEAEEQPLVEPEEQSPIEAREHPVGEQPPAEPSEQTSARRGRRHNPGVAVAAAILIPGAGQAYNGQVLKAWVLLLGSLLIIPWFYSIFDALRTARAIAADGGRRGRGGPFWIVVQAWLVVNLVLLAVIGLTISGVIR
jgi:TM2 domain-containing membrane protein YozV